MSEKLLNEAHRLIQAENFTEPKCKIQKLAGDASLRRYYRLRTPETSFILMVIEPFDAAKNDFLLVREHLQKCGVPVPGLVAVNAAKGAILLEDLGDVTMLHRLGDRNEPEAEQGLFRESLDLLALFHSRTRAKKGEQPTPGYALAFDEPKLMWEVDFALEHLFGSYLKRQIPDKEFKAIRDSFVDICRRLAAEPRVFTHRDYHSRNIMIPEGGGMVCIDFQDARMGLRAYDLASILRDSYYQLSEERVYELVNYYCGLADKDETLNRRHFIQMFDLMSIQRNFKAIGSFTSFYGKRNDASYIRFVGNTFENIRRNLAKFPEYKELRRLLFQYYYF
ncbi:MAG: aminoglycoside phosphotransferase family protein [Bdellovibrionota bacterium]